MVSLFVIHFHCSMLIIPFVNSLFAFPAPALCFGKGADSIGESRKSIRCSVVFDITTKRLRIHHIQRLQARISRKDQNTVVECNVFAGKPFKLTVSVLRDRVYQDGAQLLAAFVGVSQWRHS